MENWRSNSERGQAVVLLAVAFVVLLGFTALAVDGSIIYSDRRYAQNAADAASLAGGGDGALYLENNQVTYKAWTSCSLSSIDNARSAAVSAAIARAADNGFIIDSAIDHASGDFNGVTTTCGIDNSNPAHPEKYIDITVEITMQTQASFAHFIFSGPIQNRVKAVTRIRPREPLTLGNAIIALNPDPCSGNTNGMQFRGNLNLNVYGGGVHSNGCMDVDGGNHPNIYDGGATYVHPGDRLGNISIYDSGGNPTGQTATQIPASQIIPVDAFDLQVPDCSSHTVTANWLEGQSGLNGLYCVTGDVSINNSNTEISGEGVTLVMLGGKLTINGGMNSLTAPPPDHTGPAIPGVLIFLPKQYYGPNCGEVNQEVKINGNAMSVFTGTILAPCSDISLEGGASTFAYDGMVIGWDVNSGGNADINVIYNDNLLFSKPTHLDLYE